MFYLVSLFWLLSISGLLVLVFKKRFEIVVAISFILGTLFLYLFGFVNNIKLGYYFTWLFVFTFWLKIIYLLIRRDSDNLKEFINNYFNTGLVMFLILCIFVFIRYKNQGFSYCDEFSHWGPMLKETLRLNGFYTQTASKLIMHKDYPPFFTLLEMLWLDFGGFVYHESYAYIAINTFMFSLFMPLFAKFEIKNKKDWLSALLTLTSFILIGLTINKTETISDNAFVYNSIYIDWPLALFAAYGCYLTYKLENWDYFKILLISLILICLLLMKQIGVVYYAIVLFFAFVKVLFIDKKLDQKMFIKGIIFLIVIPLLTYLSWKVVVNQYGIVGQFEIGSLNLSTLISIIKGNTEITWKYETYVNYCDALLHRNIIEHPFKITYFGFVLLIVLFINLGQWFKRETLYLSGIFLVGAIGYAFIMLALYVLAFSIDEAPYLASFDRYMTSYLYFGSTLTLMLALDNADKQVFKYLIVLLIVILFVDKNTINYFLSSEANNKTLKITVIEQFSDGTEFEREDLDGLKLELIRPGYVEEEWGYEKIKLAIEDSNGIYVVGYDDIMYDYWNRLGIEDELYNNSYYSADDGDCLQIYFNSYSFIHYVIMYYAL